MGIKLCDRSGEILPAVVERVGRALLRTEVGVGNVTACQPQCGDSVLSGEAMPPQVFHLASRVYTVKARIRERVRRIVADADLGMPLSGEDFAFMVDLFTYHPQADIKIGDGIETIRVRQARRNPGNREFVLTQVGSPDVVDISWTECLHSTPPLAEFRNACRLAVKPWTQSFCDQEFARKAEGGRLRCEVTGELFTRREAHVDHGGKWPFRAIVAEFVRREQVDVEAVEFDGFEHGATHITLRDKALAAKFIALHNTLASLRVLSRAGNLRRGLSAEE